MPCDPAVCGLRGPGAQSESHPETQAKAGGSHGLEAGPTGCPSPAPPRGLGSALVCKNEVHLEVTRERPL